MVDFVGPVIVATDLGVAGDVALRDGHVHALADGRRLIVCHVVDPGTPDADIARTTQRVEERVGAIPDPATSDLEILVVSGEAEATILELARTRRAELLVVGESRASDGLRGMFATIPERIVRDATCSVLVARPRQGLRVLVATDLSEPSLPAIDAAGREATRRNVPLTAIHCVAPASGSQLTDVEGARLELDAALQRFGIRAEVSIQVGSPAETIIRACQGVGADLVVVGAHGRGWLPRVLVGSTAEAVVRQAPCSVLVVRA